MTQPEPASLRSVLPRYIPVYHGDTHPHHHREGVGVQSVLAFFPLGGLRVVCGLFCSVLFCGEGGPSCVPPSCGEQRPLKPAWGRGQWGSAFLLLCLRIFVVIFCRWCSAAVRACGICRTFFVFAGGAAMPRVVIWNASRDRRRPPGRR